MKKTITILLTTTAILSLAACGSNKKTTTSSSTTKASSSQVIKKNTEKSDKQNNPSDTSSHISYDTPATTTEVNTNNSTSEINSENKQSDFPFDNLYGFWKNSDGQYMTFGSNVEKTIVGYGRVPGQSSDGGFNISDAKIDGNTVSSKLEYGIGGKNTISITLNNKDSMTVSFNDGETWNLTRITKEEGYKRQQEAMSGPFAIIGGSWINTVNGKETVIAPLESPGKYSSNELDGPGWGIDTSNAEDLGNSVFLIYSGQALDGNNTKLIIKDYNNIQFIRKNSPHYDDNAWVNDIDDPAVVTYTRK